MNVANMSLMFCDCESFNQDISSWDVSNVTNMRCMFTNCINFNQDLSNWNVSNITKYDEDMFKNCAIEEKYKPKFAK